jgi:hypothetical protein
VLLHAWLCCCGLLVLQDMLKWLDCLHVANVRPAGQMQLFEQADKASSAVKHTIQVTTLIMFSHRLTQSIAAEQWAVLPANTRQQGGSAQCCCWCALAQQVSTTMRSNTNPCFDHLLLLDGKLSIAAGSTHLALRDSHRIKTPHRQRQLHDDPLNQQKVALDYCELGKRLWLTPRK